MRQSLSDILHSNSAREQLAADWDRTDAAGDFAPLPAGHYIAHVQSVELFTAKKGTPGVKIVFRVAEGEHAGRKVFHDSWLTAAALPATKRDCAKLGIMKLEQLETANVPPGCIRCDVRIALRTDDNGEQFNKVRGFDVLGIDEPDADAFAPADEPPSGAPETGSASADAVSFDYGANVAGGEK